MANIIHITERGNRLFIEDTYTPIVCGNSNYVLEFNFSEEWQKANNKTAMFMVENKRTLVVFEGTTCKVPVLANGPYVLVSLLSSPTENEQLVTTRIRLRLEPNPFSEPYSEDEAQKRYASAIHGMVNDIQNGNISVKHAESSDVSALANHSNSTDFASQANQASQSDYSLVAGSSETQVDLTSDQIIQGTKNFVGSLQTNNFSVLNTSQISNPNILINANFIINQRGQTTYSTAEEYTVDRWRLISGTVDAVDEGIVLNGTICQPLEHIPTESVSLSFDNSSGEVEGFYENGIVTLSANNVLIRWAKLEYGDVVTKFIPRLYAEELALCQRYYIKYSTSLYSYTNTSGNIYASLVLPTQMRALSIKSIDSSSSLMVGNGSYGDLNNSKIVFQISRFSSNIVSFWISSTSSTPSSIMGIGTKRAYILSGFNCELDGEIY